MNAVSVLQRFLKNEDGPTAVEYAIMLALIFGVIIFAVATLGDNTNDSYETIRDEVNTVMVESTGG
jgi:pilus assembly protein Flp/PilA